MERLRGSHLRKGPRHCWRLHSVVEGVRAHVGDADSLRGAAVPPGCLPSSAPLCLPRVSPCAGLGPWGVGAVRTPAAEYVLSRSAAPLNLRSRLLSCPLVSSGAPLVPAARPRGGCVIVAHVLSLSGPPFSFFPCAVGMMVVPNP